MSPSEAENSLHQSDHRADEGLRRVGLRSAVARDLDHDERAPEPLDDERRNKAAAIAAHIDDKRFLADLRKVLLGEFVQARLAHVGDMDIADFAARFSCSTSSMLFCTQAL